MAICNAAPAPAAAAAPPPEDVRTVFYSGGDSYLHRLQRDTGTGTGTTDERGEGVRVRIDAIMGTRNDKLSAMHTSHANTNTMQIRNECGTGERTARPCPHLPPA